MASASDRSPTVFLTYAVEDREFAERVFESLSGSANVLFGLSRFFDDPGFVRQMLDSVSSRDYLVFLLSTHSLDAGWIERELGLAESRELVDRSIELIPVSIDGCRVPAVLSNWQAIDISEDYHSGIESLLGRIVHTHELDFNSLSMEQFESMVRELLSVNDIFVERSDPSDGYDFRAYDRRADLFGKVVRDLWLVEINRVKSVVPLARLRSFAEVLRRHQDGAKGLLVTDGKVTSVSRDFTQELARQERIEIRVVDGSELKRLISAEQGILERYFGLSEPRK